MNKNTVSNIAKYLLTPIVLIIVGIAAVRFISTIPNDAFRFAISHITNRVALATAPAPVIVEKLRPLNRIETAIEVKQHIVEAKSESRLLPGFLGKDNLMMMVQTETIAGVDLSRLSDKDVSVENGVVTIRLPNPTIFHVRIDDQNSKVYNRERGLLVFKPDMDLERQARLKAQSDAYKIALSGEMMSDARLNAEQNLRTLLKSIGLNQVKFIWGNVNSAV